MTRESSLVRILEIYTDAFSYRLSAAAFLAIIPLAKLLAFATDEMSMRVGQTLAGLLNATLGNA